MKDGRMAELELCMGTIQPTEPACFIADTKLLQWCKREEEEPKSLCLTWRQRPHSAHLSPNTIPTYMTSKKSPPIIDHG